MEAIDVTIMHSGKCYDSENYHCEKRDGHEIHCNECHAYYEETRTGGIAPAATVPLCAYDVGDILPCRCLLPRGHEGKHICKHVS